MPVIDHDGVRASYRESGAGHPVLLLHSSAFTGGQWRSLQDRISGHFRCLAPDLYGYGGTDRWPGHAPFTLTEEVNLALASCPDEPVHLVGHSYGGAVALRLALTRPDRVRSLTLIEPAAFYLLRDGWSIERRLFAEFAQVAGAVSQGLVSGDLWSGMSRFVDYWNGLGTWDRLDADKRTALGAFAAKIAMEFSAVTAEQTPITQYRELTVPTLILRGDKSPGTTRQIANMLASAMPKALLRTVEGAGHMLPLTHAEIVNDAIEHHLVRCGGVRPAAASALSGSALTAASFSVPALSRYAA